MKISRIINFACFSLLIGGLAGQTSSYAQNVSQSQLVAQSETEDKSAVIQNKAEEMINLFFARKFDSFADSVVPELNVSVSPEKMEKAWQETKEENGTFVKIAESKVIQTPTTDLVTVTLEFEKVTEDWIFVFNKKQEIVGINAPISKSVQNIADKFITSVIEGDYSQARILFHPFLKETIFPQQIESSWNNLITKNGKFERIISTRLRRGSTLEQTDVVVVDLQFGKGEEEVLIIFDSSKNIIGVDFVQQ